jgi:hypothetical protein
MPDLGHREVVVEAWLQQPKDICCLVLRTRLSPHTIRHTVTCIRYDRLPFVLRTAVGTCTAARYTASQISGSDFIVSAELSHRYCCQGVLERNTFRNVGYIVKAASPQVWRHGELEIKKHHFDAFGGAVAVSVVALGCISVCGQQQTER